MKKMVILSYGHFPQGGASSIRLCSIAKLFMSKEFDVYVIAMGNTDYYKWEEYDSIKYISIRSESKNILSRIGNVLNYKSRVKKVLEGLGHIDAFLLSGVFPSVFKFCEQAYSINKNNVKLFTDCTEWYSVSEFALGYFSPEYWRNIIINNRMINKKWKVISISRFLEDYFTKKGIKTVRIPAVMDTTEFDVDVNHYNSKRIIVYAGSPAKKDAIELIVKGFIKAESKIKNKLELHIIGMTQNQFVKIYKDIILSENILFLGRLPREDVKKHLAGSDFTTLMRDERKRYAKAGFPSKVAESLSAGIPAIINYTSDLELYLSDHDNSVIVKGFSVEEYTEALLDAAAITDAQLKKMKCNARKTAELYFDYRVYEKEIEELLQ